MSVKRYALEQERWGSNTFGCPDGDYVLFKDYAAHTTAMREALQHIAAAFKVGSSEIAAYALRQIEGGEE